MYTNSKLLREQLLVLRFLSVKEKKGNNKTHNLSSADRRKQTSTSEEIYFVLRTYNFKLYTKRVMQSAGVINCWLNLIQMPQKPKHQGNRIYLLLEKHMETNHIIQIQRVALYQELSTLKNLDFHLGLVRWLL